jgi:hypothetical protein
MAIVEQVQIHAHAVLLDFCNKIKALPEIVRQKEAAQISRAKWDHYIVTLARKAIAGEDLIPVTNEFNRLYVFPFRERKTSAG